MKISRNQLRRLIREQIESISGGVQQLYRRAARYAFENGEMPGSKYQSDDESPNYIGIIYDERDVGGEEDPDQGPYTPFNTNFYTSKITPEIAAAVHQETSVFKKGPVSIQAGWFWHEVDDYDGSRSAGGPYPSREAARAACLRNFPDIIQPGDVQNTPNAMLDDEAGF